MGYAIAEAVLAEGHDVTLISGPVNVAPPHDARLISVSTSDQMFEAVHQHVDKCDICVLCAAVADYKPAHVSSNKIKKQSEKFSLELVPTRDILTSLGQRQDRQFVLVGFAAETDHLEENAGRDGRTGEVGGRKADAGLVGLQGGVRGDEARTIRVADDQRVDQGKRGETAEPFRISAAHGNSRKPAAR